MSARCLPTGKTRTLDVRPVIARGEEPFTEIMAAVEAVKPDEDCVVIAPILQLPLIEELCINGFRAPTDLCADGGWST